MTDTKSRKLSMENNLSHLGGGEAPYVVNAIKQELEGWREVLIPISSVLRWDRPYYPGILLGASTTLFGLIWMCDLTVLTTISMICLVVGILDFSIPYFGSTITGYQIWTDENECKFTEICENVANFRQNYLDVWQGFVTMRKHNSKSFFIILMGILSFTAWIGNLIDNLFLTYIIVSFCLCLPGLLCNETTRQYFLRGTNTLRKLQGILIKPKQQ